MSYNVVMGLSADKTEGRELPFFQDEVVFRVLPVESQRGLHIVPNVRRVLRTDGGQEFDKKRSLTTWTYAFPERSYLGIHIDLESRRLYEIIDDGPSVQELLDGTDAVLRQKFGDTVPATTLFIATTEYKPNSMEQIGKAIWRIDPDRSIHKLLLSGEQAGKVEENEHRVVAQHQVYTMLIPGMRTKLDTLLPPNTSIKLLRHWDFAALRTNLDIGVVEDIYVLTNIDITGHEGKRSVVFEDIPETTPISFFNPPEHTDKFAIPQ